MRKFRPAQRYDFGKGTFAPTEQEKPLKRKKTPTNGLTAAICDYVELRGGYAMRINVAGFYRHDVGYIKSGSTIGTPDLIAVVRGRFVGIEVKIGKDRQSDSQKAVEQRITEAAGVYIVARDFEQFRVEFDEITKSF
jgi:hypothetical protein